MRVHGARRALGGVPHKVAELVLGAVRARRVGTRLSSPIPDVTRLGGHTQDHGTIWTTTGAVRATNGAPKATQARRPPDRRPARAR